MEYAASNAGLRSAHPPGTIAGPEHHNLQRRRNPAPVSASRGPGRSCLCLSLCHSPELLRNLTGGGSPARSLILRSLRPSAGSNPRSHCICNLRRRIPRRVSCIHLLLMQATGLLIPVTIMIVQLATFVTPQTLSKHHPLYTFLHSDNDNSTSLRSLARLSMSTLQDFIPAEALQLP